GLRRQRRGVWPVAPSSKSPTRLDDPLASREHARLHVSGSDGGLSFLVEDLKSANGTRVRNSVIAPGELTPFVPGDAIAIGSTVLMVQQNRPTVGPRRLWSHAYFESRLTDECVRAGASGRSFAMARVHLNGSAARTRVVSILGRNIPLSHASPT